MSQQLEIPKTIVDIEQIHQRYGRKAYKDGRTIPFFQLKPGFNPDERSETLYDWNKNTKSWETRSERQVLNETLKEV